MSLMWRSMGILKMRMKVGQTWTVQMKKRKRTLMKMMKETRKRMKATRKAKRTKKKAAGRTGVERQRTSLCCVLAHSLPLR